MIQSIARVISVQYSKSYENAVNYIARYLFIYLDVIKSLILTFQSLL